MAKRKQFTFYYSFYDALMELPVELAKEALWIVVTYALTGNEPEVEQDPAVKMALKLIRPVVDSGRKKAMAGAKGQENVKKRKMEISLEPQRISDTQKQDADNKPSTNTQHSGNKKEKEVEKEVEIEVEVEIEKDKEKESFNTDCVCVNRDTHTDSFERFWNDYPIHLGKQQALDIWIQDPPDLDRVMVALACWKKSRQWLQENGRFIPKAATFLKEKYYEQPPKDGVPTGASGYLGKAELEAIERLMNGNV